MKRRHHRYVTEESVEQAIQELQRAGKPHGARRILKHLGGGSLETLHRILVARNGRQVAPAKAVQDLRKRVRDLERRLEEQDDEWFALEDGLDAGEP